MLTRGQGRRTSQGGGDRGQLKRLSVGMCVDKENPVHGPSGAGERVRRSPASSNEAVVLNGGKVSGVLDKTCLGTISWQKPVPAITEME